VTIAEKERSVMFETAGVVGAGTMGNGIAQVLAASGRKVRLVDVNRQALDRGMTAIQKSLSKLVEKGKVSAADKDATLERLQPATDLDALQGSTIAIEAVVESLPTKMAVFAKLQEILGEDAVLASNTSSISITEIARTVQRPERVIGMHFMNPVPLMELVEIVRGVKTSEETVGRVRDLAAELGKTPVVVQDYPGFVSNRVLMPMINEAIFCLMEGVADKEAIDTVMKLGMAHPMGPLKLADLIGLDVCLQILEVLHQGFGDPKYRPCPLLRNMVAAGRLGRKTGEGFYSYST
jgi:3-hydroxybutyryl-CoA dehydrogenase